MVATAIKKVQLGKKIAANGGTDATEELLQLLFLKLNLKNISATFKHGPNQN
ncbi:hypothetical protein [Pedobacter jejuensis]|uniref:hypothetical protein n=1 Tax=Pedobacter jejuensis TaxID=1268550 RepID=UPI00142DC237|nr:hypothetical protein [Pedobacter jejuensis]